MKTDPVLFANWLGIRLLMYAVFSRETALLTRKREGGGTHGPFVRIRHEFCGGAVD